MDVGDFESQLRMRRTEPFHYVFQLLKDGIPLHGTFAGFL